MKGEIVLSSQRFLRLVDSRISRGIPLCHTFCWRRRALNCFGAVKDKDPVIFSFVVEDYSNALSSEVFSVVCSYATSRKIAIKLRDSYDVFEELPF